MYRLPHRFVLSTLLALIAVVAHLVPPLFAQGDCQPMLAALIEATSEGGCREINVNWACYGVEQVQAKPGSLRFKEPGNREPITQFEEIRTEAPNGTVLMYIKATSQDTPLNLMVFGDLSVKSLAADSFEVAANTNDMRCSNTPSGLVIQTDKRRQGAIKINNIEITLGSTVFVTINTADLMTVANVEGHVAVAIRGGPSVAIDPGEQVRVPDSSDPTQIIGPEPAQFVNSPVVQFLAMSPEGLRRVGDPNTGDPSPEALVPACGGTIRFGQTIGQSTYTLGQECLFTFTANLNNFATIDLATDDPFFDPWVDLRDPDGALIGSNNDLAANDLNSQLCNVPLLARTGDYTIVVRSHRNNSKGAFNVTLNSQTACEPAEPRCQVVTPRLNLRSGPDLTYPVLKVLTQAARLQPLARNPEATWLYVEDLDDGVNGWVYSDLEYLSCENGPTPTLPVITPTLTSTPTPTPTSPQIDPATLTVTPGPGCGSSALAQKYGLPGGDLRACPQEPTKTGTPSTPPPPPTVSTPTPPPDIKDPPVPGP